MALRAPSGDPGPPGSATVRGRGDHNGATSNLAPHYVPSSNAPQQGSPSPLLDYDPLLGPEEGDDEWVDNALDAYRADDEVEDAEMDDSPGQGSQSPPADSLDAQVARELAATERLPVIHWEDGFVAACNTIVASLNTMTSSLREHRILIRRLLPSESRPGWEALNAALDRLNSTVYDLSGDFAHAAGVAFRLADDLAELDRRFENTGPSPSAPAPQPDPVADPAPLEAPPRFPSPLSPRFPSRSPSPGPTAAGHRPTLLDRLGGASPRTTPDPPNWADVVRRGASPLTPSLPATPALAKRLRSPAPGPDARSRTRYDVSPSPAPSSRGRSPAPKRFKRPPPHVTKTVFVVFTEGGRVPPEKRLPAGSIQKTLSTSFERSGDLSDFCIHHLAWSASGNITVILSQVPNEAALNFLKERTAAVLNVPIVYIDVRTYQYRTSLAFRRVPCITDGGLPIPIREAARPLELQADWAPYINSPDTRLRWGPDRGQKLSSRMLVVDIQDDSSHSIGKALEAISVLFPDGARRARILPDKPKVPQCGSCLAWGHVASVCRSPTDVCDRCGGPHHVRLHNTLAACCEERPDRLSSECPHPPRCRNCKGAHYASDRACEWSKHRNDRAWYAAQGQALPHANIPLHNTAKEPTRKGGLTDNPGARTTGAPKRGRQRKRSGRAGREAGRGAGGSQ